MTDIDLLAATAYETGIDPVTYAAENVIQAHIDVYLSCWDSQSTAALSRRIVADLLNAGWSPPEVTR